MPEQIHQFDFLPGDILCHTFSAKMPFGHSGLVIDPTPDSHDLGNTSVIEVGGNGMNLGPPQHFATPAKVFRPIWTNRWQGEALSRQALAMYNDGRNTLRYRRTTVFHGAALNNSWGPKAHARLATYRIKYKERGGAPTSAYCSEFVVLVFQLALPLDDDLFIQLDAKHTRPGALRKHLEANDHFDYIDTVTS